MKARSKRMLAWILALAMMLPNMPFNGSLVAYAANTDGSAEVEQQIRNEDASGESGSENAGEEQKPDGGSDDGQKPGSGNSDDGQTSDDGSSDDVQKPGSGNAGEEQKPDGGSGDVQKPGSGNSDEEQKPGGGSDDVQKPGDSSDDANQPDDGSLDDENLPGGGLNPGEDDSANDDTSGEECEHTKLRYVSCCDGTHEVVCEACDAVLQTEDCTYGESVSENGTESDHTCIYCGYVLEEEKKAPAPAYRGKARASERKRIAYFSFDDETDGFKGDGAAATKSGTLTRNAWRGKALQLSSGQKQFLNVTKDDGTTSLLTGLEGITVSYYSKAGSGGSGWSFYAAPNANAPSYNNENYLGILDKTDSVATESYIKGRNGNESAKPSTNGLSNEWRHVVVTFDQTGVALYIDGQKTAGEERKTASSIATMLGDSSIIQIGKAQWGEEYYNGLIDEFSIYDYVMDAEEVSALYESSFEEDATVSDQKMLAHYAFSDIKTANNITEGTAVPENATVPNTAPDATGYDAQVINSGAQLYEEGSSLLLPGGAANTNPAYVKLPGEMFTDSDGRMRDVLTVNLWMKNLSPKGDWTGFYVGTDPTKNTGGTMPLNYLLLNPRKENMFKATLTYNEAAKGDPYNGEQICARGQTSEAWQMYTVVIGPTTMTTYLDGEQVGRRTHAMKMSEWTADGTSAVPDILASIGAGGYLNDPRWNGAVKECSIYNYKLSAEEIGQLYQDGLEKEEVPDPMMLAHYRFDDIASYEGNASKVNKGQVSDGAVVPNTSEATKDKNYNAVVHGTGGSLRAGGIGLELPGGAADEDSAYVELPSTMFTGDNGKMRNILSINLWMQNISGAGDWTGFYIGTDAAKNTSNTIRPLNYLLVNPRKDNRFKVAMTYNQEVTSEPYNKENLNVNGTTSDWWQMYTVVVNSTNLTTYLDGKKLGTVKHSMKMSDWTADGTADVPTILAYIGKGGYVKDPRWHGAVKECSIYNYELTQEEITQLYDDVHAPDTSAPARVTATAVATDFLGEGGATIDYGDSYDLPSKTSVTLSDGKSNAAYVTWYDEKGQKVTDTSVLDPGAHTLTGKLENYFPAPFIEERADPQVYYDEASKKYYFTSSWPAYGAKEKGYDKVVIRQSDTLLGLADAEEHTIWTAPGDKYTGRYHIWAPELHHIGSKWYCYFAGTLSGDWDIRPRILVCDDTKDITQAENWTEHDRFMNKDGTDAGGFDGFALDMTHFENKGKHYVIWAYKPIGSELLMGEVSADDPTKLIGDPMVLTYPEYAWECAGGQNVDEGPAVLKANGRIYIAFSAAATGDMYCMGMMSADENADLMDITSWTKSPTPALQTKDLQQQYGPGHNSFTVDEDGNAILVYHARDERCHTGSCGYSNVDSLYDPCRDAMLAYVRYDEDGTPVFNSTADKELANLDTSGLKYTLTVQGLTEAEPLAAYALVTDAKDSVSGTHTGSLQGEDAAFDQGLILSGNETANLVNYLDISDNEQLLADLEASKGLTITAWVRNDNLSKDDKGPNNNNRPTVFSLGRDEKNFFAFSTGNWGAVRASFYLDGTEIGDGDGKNRIQYNTPGMVKSVVGEWYPIAITMKDVSVSGKSKTRVSYYMDDELVCSVDTPASIRDLGGLKQFYIGGGISAGNYHDMYGGIRNVKIYNKTLPGDLIAKYDKAYLADNLAIMLGADLTTHAIETGISLPLPKTGHPGVTYTWQTSDASVMDENGEITPSTEERTVTLTATIKTTLDSEYEKTVTFPVTVLNPYAFALGEVYKALQIRNIDDVRGSLYLPQSDVRYPEVKISWKSGNANIISDQEKDGIAPGLVKRPDADTDVTLTAILSVGEEDTLLTKEKVFTAKVKKRAQVGELTDYMFAYFIGEGTKAGEQMYFADSRDGLHWKALNDGKPVITSNMGEKGLRDPFIMRSHEGDKFYLIATDLWIAGGTSWGDSQTKGSKSIMVWESTDLVNWSQQRMCKVAVDEAGCTWAPEAFWDEEAQDYVVFWASKTSLDNYGPHHIWKCHTRDFYTYTEPEIWITLKNASGNDISVIDTTVIKDGSTYYRFSKNEDGGDAVMTDGSTIKTKAVYMEKSNSLNGPWEYIPSPYLLDSSNQYREGATSFQFNGDDADVPTWCLLLDNFGGGGYYPAISTDLASGSFTKLDASEYSFPTEGILRHGSVLNITAAEYEALEKKWTFTEEADTPVTTLQQACIASFTFDDAESGFTGSGAVAEQKGAVMLSNERRGGAPGKSVRLRNGSWLDVKAADGQSLLTGVESLSISYYSRATDPNQDGAGWAFYAAPNANAPQYNVNETYLGIIDHVGEVRAERFHGTRNSDTSTSVKAVSLENEWRHVVVSYTPKGIKLYVDGALKKTVASRYLSSLSKLLGENSILQLGKGNWSGGEYFNGYIDDLTIYNRELTQEEVSALYTGEALSEVYTVLFEPEGGMLTGETSQTVNRGDKLIRPAEPVREGYTFLGWRVGTSSTKYWDFEKDVVVSPLTLFACWEENIIVDDPENKWGDILYEDRPESGVIPEGIWIAGVNAEGYSYTGKAIKPEVRVYNNRMRLNLKTDYTISYRNNTKANDASVPKTAPTITVTGKGNFTGKDTAYFVIRPKQLTDADIFAADSTVAYRANKVQKPLPVVTWNGKKLANKKDITVTYPDNDITDTSGDEPVVIEKAYSDPGRWNVVITGTGNYAGTKTVTLTIAEKNAKLTEKLKVKKIPNQTYLGEPVKPSLVVEDGNAVLREGVHYDVSFENNNRIGTATVIIKGKQKAAAGKQPGFCYVGEKRMTFKIVGRDIRKAAVTEGLEKSYPYTGKAIRPEPALAEQVKEDGVTVPHPLKPGEDYLVTYANNIKAGTATITFKGIGTYSGTLIKTFKITAYDLAADEDGRMTIEALGDYPYEKGGSRPKPIVKYRIPDKQEVILTEGVDYILSYKNNTGLNDCTASNQGKWPTVTVKGKGNFKGSKPLTFKIVRQDIGNLEIQTTDKVFQNRVNKYQSAPKVIDRNGKALKNGTDYEKIFAYTYAEATTLADGELKAAGDPVGSKDILPVGTVVRVTVTGKNSYTGTLSGTYRITAKSITKASVTVQPQIYTGLEVKPGKDQITKITVGRDTLQEDDYEIIDYTNNIKKGTAKMIIKGVGDYGGTKTVTFKITARKIAWWGL